MKSIKENKGFSLVELIIVIAIMAILVGVMAPQLIKYIEKSKISSDQNLLDSLETAITYAVFDPVVNEDNDSRPAVDEMLGVVDLEYLEGYADTLLYKEIVDTLGWPDLSHATYAEIIKSHHDVANCEIKLSYCGDFTNPIVIWITTTDRTGNKKTEVANNVADLATCDNIRLE